NATPIAYIWARTIISEAPSAGRTPVEVPLLSSMWLAKKNGRHQALRWRRDKGGKIETVTTEKTYQDGQRMRVAQPLLEIYSPREMGDVEPGTSKAGS